MNRYEEVSWRIEPAIHRTTKPQIPSREDLIKVMTSANVETLNVLVIDLNGHFKMLTPHDKKEHQKQLDGSYIAVRHESFSAGTGYVGPEILEDKDFIEDVYLSMLYGWYEHIKTNRFRVYIDYPALLEEEKLIKEIAEATKQLS